MCSNHVEKYTGQTENSTVPVRFGNIVLHNQTPKSVGDDFGHHLEFSSRLLDSQRLVFRFLLLAFNALYIIYLL